MLRPVKYSVRISAAGPCGPGASRRRGRRGPPRGSRRTRLRSPRCSRRSRRVRPATDAEAVDGRDHRDPALVDRPERCEAAPVGADQRVEALGVLHLLDVHAGVEALALGPQHHDVGVQVAAGLVERFREVEPRLHGQGVDRRVVHRDDADAVVLSWEAKPCRLPGETTKHLLGSLHGGTPLLGPRRPRCPRDRGQQGIGGGIAEVLVGRCRGRHVRPVRGRVPAPAPPTCSATYATRMRCGRWSMLVGEHGRLDMLVNNAGGSPYALAADASPRFLDKVLGLNLPRPSSSPRPPTK